ncbi:MAG: FmdB family zinc ribbon protein [Dehalococcoidia bacterium]
MPTYEYGCSKCKAQYELRQGFDAALTHPCEECGKGTAKRILHAPRVVFKGSGWYVTDSKKSSSAIADTPSTDGPTASAPEASDTPAAKSDNPEKPAKKESASKSSSSAGPEAAAAG